LVGVKTLIIRQKNSKSDDHWTSNDSFGVKTLKIRKKKSKSDDPWTSNDSVGVKALKICQKIPKVMTPGRQMIWLELKL
jgi:uncharacterized protein YxjI